MHKKILTVLSVMTCLLLPKSQANDIEPTKEFYTAIRKGTAPMVIDGTLSEWTGVPVLSDPRFAIPKGAGAGGVVQTTPNCTGCVNDQASPNYVLWESLGGSWSGPDDQTSAVEVVWDADNVYLGFIVTDDYHENASGNAWNGDSVQLMIATEAGRAAGAAPAPGGNYFLYNFALLGVEGATTDVLIHEETPPTGVDPDVEAVVRRDAAGKKTYYEIRLSAAALNLTPPLTAGLKFGLGMAINDGDEAQPGQQGWGGLGAHSIVFGKHPVETALVTLSSQTPGSDIVFFSAVNAGITSFSFRVNDLGTSISDPATVKLTVNGQVVQTTATAKANGVFDVTYTPASPFLPGSQNTYSIEVKDTAGATASDSGSFTTPQYVVLTAADKVTPDATKPGFIFKVHQNGTLVENSYVRAIDQLEGRLGPNRADPNAQGPAIAPAAGNGPADTNKPITFEIATVVNLNVDLNTGLGNFTTDEQMPGTPGIDPTVAAFAPGVLDGVAADITTYVTLTAGLHTLIVNSDDGFKAFMGNVNDVFSRKLAGQFDLIGGRGAADTAFTVSAPEDGVYALRVIFHQGGGGGNIELVEQLANGTKVLLNDEASGGPKTYRAITGPAAPTSITSVAPGVGSTRADGNGNVTVTIVEGTDAVNLSSIVLKIDGATVATTPVKNGNVITVSGKTAEPLTTRALHNASITYTAGTAAARTETWSFTTVRYPSGSLFIEAEDFNFSQGEYIQDKPIGMTGWYAGDAYFGLGDGNGVAACTGTDHGIDYNDNTTLDATDANPFRDQTNVEIAKRNGPAGRDRGLFFVDVDHTIGWTGTAEWMNYTRDFPTTGITTYKVFARMAHGDAAARRGGTLSRVTTDPAICDQQSVLLGRFSGPWTGGWDTWPDAGTEADALLPMLDNAGTPAIIRITGKQTLKWQFAEGSGDLDYIVFVPFFTTGIPPAVASVSPAANSVGNPVTPTITANIVKGEFVNVASASMTLDGVAVPATVTLADGGATVTYTVPTPLAPGPHTIVITHTDNASPAVTRTSSVTFNVTFTPLPAGTLFIEAEDFNFNRGSYVTAEKIGMDGAYPGGSYAGLGSGNALEVCADGSDNGIDYMDNTTLEGTDGNPYRPNTTVEAAKRNGPAGFNRGTFNVQVNHVIGWTGTAEWMNYTRDFPTTPTAYRVYARMAHGDAVNGTRGGVLFKVTGDLALCADPNQITEELGTFQGPWTGGWDTWPDAGTPQDALIPLKDANGAVAKITLGGKTTLRFQYADNAGDIDYLAFVPAGTTPPKFLTFSPQPNAQGIVGDFESSIQDQDLTLTSASLAIDGTPVNATVTKVGDVTTIKYLPTNLVPGSNHTYTLTYTDSAGLTLTRSTSFRVSFSPLPTGTLFIEAEDFNFGKGQYVTDTQIGMNGAYPGGSYQDRGDGLDGTACDGSDFGIDYNDGNSVQDDPVNTAIYRPTTPVEAAKRNGSAGLYRGTFNVEVNHVLGWTSGAEWMNYTRDFPATPTTYKVYARIAHGDVNARRGGILSRLTGGDPALCNDQQVFAELGRFSAPWTGGWDTFPDAGTEQDALIPMKDSAGAIATVTLGGKQTLRFQYAEGAGDFDYLAFVPSGPVTPPPPQFLKPRINANGSITVEWTGGGVLETTPALGPNQTWTPVPNQTSPFTFTPQAGVNALFARIRVP